MDSSVTMVERMREIRNQLSIKIMNMSFEEENTYIRKQLIELKNKRMSAGSAR